MKTHYLALFLFSGCIYDQSNYLIQRNTETIADTALLESETARVLYSGFYLTNDTLSGGQELHVASSGTPFLCDSDGPYDFDNHIKISAKLPDGFAPGVVLPLENYEAFLSRQGYPSSYVASLSAPEDDNIVGGVEIQELTGSSFSGRITLQISGSRAFFELPPEEDLAVINFTLDIVEAPVCTIFTY